MENNTPPRWGFHHNHGYITVLTGARAWNRYWTTTSLTGDVLWQFYSSGEKPPFLAPEGTPLPDPIGWPETHAKLIAAINAAINDAIASVVAKEVS